MACILWCELPMQPMKSDENEDVFGKREFLVYSDNNTDTGTEATAVIPVARGDVHPTQARAVCVSVDVDNAFSNGVGWWKIVCEYSSVQKEKEKQKDTNDTNKSDHSNNPDVRPLLVSFDSETREKVLTNEDFSNPTKKIQMSNGQAIDGGIPYTDVILLINIQGSVGIRAGDGQRWQSTYLNKINEKAFNFGTIEYAIGTLLARRGRWDTSWENNRWWWKFDIQLAWDREGWNKQVRDRGTWERLSQNGPPNPILIDGIPTRDPVDLNGAGLKNPDGADPVYLTFQTYRSQDFANILAGRV